MGIISIHLSTVYMSQRPREIHNRMRKSIKLEKDTIIPMNLHNNVVKKNKRQ